MALWTPVQLGTALKAWWYAPDIAQGDGTAVASWTDRAGSAFVLAQGTGANQPTYKTAIQNGRAVVRFDGTNDWLNLASTLGISAQPWTYAAVWSPANSTQEGLLGWHDGVTARGNVYRDPAATLELFNGGAGVIDIAISGTGMRVTAGIFNGASSLSSHNGTSQTGTMSSNAIAGTLRVGAIDAAPTYWLNGDIGEIVFTNTALSTTDRQKLEGYLAWGWGLQANLSGGHPYASAAPTVGANSGLRFGLGDRAPRGRVTR